MKYTYWISVTNMLRRINGLNVDVYLQSIGWRHANIEIDEVKSFSIQVSENEARVQFPQAFKQ